MKKKTSEASRKLSWARSDPERRMGFEGGRYLKVSALPSFLLAAIFAVAFYAVLVFVPECAFKSTFTERGWTQRAVVLFGAWTFFLLWFKTRKIKLQRVPLRLPIVLDDSGFVLTERTIDAVADQIARVAESPKDFLLYRRILLTLSNLRNLGQVSEVDALFRSQAEQDESMSETSYSLVTGFLWAIPILGFVGTVIGLSGAIGNFTGVLQSTGDDPGQLTDALKDVTGGLSTAFETTLVALSVALALQLLATFVRKSEEELLDDISEFCSANVVAKIRVEKERLLDKYAEGSGQERNEEPR